MNTKTYSSDQIIKDFKLLCDAASQGIIDLDLIAAQIEMNKRKEYLESHKFKIWEGTNEYWYTYVEGDEKRKLVKKKTKETLEDYLVDYYKALDPDENPTFKQEYNAWMESRKEYSEVKPSSILRYGDDYKRFFEGTEFESIKISEIDDLILDDFVRSTIARKHLTAKAYSGLRTVIIGVLKYAKRKKHTSFSVSLFFSDFQISKSAFKKPSSKKKRIYTEEERQMLYEHMMKKPTMQNLGLSLMCLTGLRIGELSAIKKEDNVSSCLLYIHRTESVYEDEADKKKKAMVQETPKMDHEETIIIPKAAQRIIDIANMQSHGDEYLFSIKGKRITTRSFRCALKKACEEIGIEYRSPHQMRKTYASILLSSGVDEAVIKREMRHTEISTTRAYYQYITKEDDYNKELIDKITGL